MNAPEYTGDKILELMSLYAPNRNKAVENLIATHLGFDKLMKGAKVLEFGAGRGEFIFRFISHPNLELMAVEIDSSYLKNLATKIKVFSDIDQAPSDLDAIYLIDVLEHLEDDRYYLKKFYEKLKTGGRLFIYVPARKELYSVLDKSIGHYRRYTLKELKTKVNQSGFSVIISRYHELLGYFASMVNKIVNRKSGLNTAAVKAYDRYLVPATNFLEKYIRIPIGKSIYLCAEKKE
jgi:SAM-dependent methyltransferase